MEKYVQRTEATHEQHSNKLPHGRCRLCWQAKREHIEGITAAHETHTERQHSCVKYTLAQHDELTRERKLSRRLICHHPGRWELETEYYDDDPP